MGDNNLILCYGCKNNKLINVEVNPRFDIYNLKTQSGIIVNSSEFNQLITYSYKWDNSQMESNGMYIIDNNETVYYSQILASMSNALTDSKTSDDVFIYGKFQKYSEMRVSVWAESNHYGFIKSGNVYTMIPEYPFSINTNCNMHKQCIGIFNHTLPTQKEYGNKCYSTLIDRATGENIINNTFYYNINLLHAQISKVNNIVTDYFLLQKTDDYKAPKQLFDCKKRKIVLDNITSYYYTIKVGTEYCFHVINGEHIYLYNPKSNTWYKSKHKVIYNIGKHTNKSISNTDVCIKSTKEVIIHQGEIGKWVFNMEFKEIKL